MKIFFPRSLFKFLLVLVALGGAFVAAVHAQAAKVDDGKWRRIESLSKDFSIDLPVGDYLVESGELEDRIWYFGCGRTLFVSMEKIGYAKHLFGIGSVSDEVAGWQKMELGDFVGRWHSVAPGENGSEFDEFEFASSHGYYTISVRVPKGDHAFAERFLRTARLGGKPLLDSGTSDVDESETVSIKSFKTSKIVEQALKQPPPNLEYDKDSGVGPAVETDTSSYTRDLVILSNPNPKYTYKNVTGSMNVMVTFLANGKIGSIRLGDSVDDAFDRIVFEAAKGIKFLPAEIDGKPVDVTRRIPYTVVVNQSQKIKPSRPGITP